jgi:hypothetical protein
MALALRFLQGFLYVFPECLCEAAEVADGIG